MNINLQFQYFRNNKKRKVLSDLESFKTEIRKSGINPEGTTLCNCEVGGKLFCYCFKMIKSRNIVDYFDADDWWE